MVGATAPAAQPSLPIARPTLPATPPTMTTDTPAFAPQPSGPVAPLAQYIAALKQQTKAVNAASQASTNAVGGFKIFPLSGPRRVSPEVDPVLGNSGFDNKICNWLSSLHWTGKLVANGYRGFMSVGGPLLYWASAVHDWNDLQDTYKDKTATWGQKIALTAGTLGVGVGATAATIASVPLKALSWLRIPPSKLMVFNRGATIMSAFASMAFSGVNLVHVLHDKTAQPAERFFAKLTFGAGTFGLLGGIGSLLMTLTPGGAAVAEAAPWLLKICSNAVGFATIASLITWGCQRFLGRSEAVNNWVNRQLKGSWLG